MRRLACLVILAACGSSASPEVDPNDPLPPPPEGVGVQSATEILVRSFTASAEQILSAAWAGQSPPAWMGLEKTEG